MKLRFQASILDNVRDSIIVTDTDGKIVYWNKGAERIFGYSSGEMIGQSPARLYDATSDRKLEDDLHEIREGGEVSQVWRGRRKDGTVIWVDIKTSVMRDPLGEAIGFIGVSKDVTAARHAEERQAELLAREREAWVKLEAERARLEEHLRRVREIEAELQQAVRVRDTFLSIASHELNTPLTSLKLQIQALERQAATAPLKGLTYGSLEPRLRMIDRQLGRLTKLVMELLDISRITSGRLKLELEELDLSALVKDVVLHASEDLRKAGCELRLEVAPGVTGTWDRLRLEQVLANLLSNAIRYGQGAPVVVSLTGDARTARLVVKDYGIGIAAEDQARIFEQFERASSQRHYGGLGLGLWIVRQILDSMGGTIQVASEPGQGAAFSVELPRHHTQA
jgi:PAS domain S-box-containing protein